MLFNQTCEYAFRAMALLATRAKPCRAEELAEEAQIPGHYVSKVMRRMVVGGLVESKRGRGGGFQLARDPSEIRFADILEAADAKLEGDHCAFGLGDCSTNEPCVLHPVWSSLKTQVGTWAENTTLADIGKEGG